MPEPLISPIIPSSSSRIRQVTRTGRLGRPLPLATLTEPVDPVLDVIYGMARLDDSGRLADRAITSVLGWRPGDRLTITAAIGAVVAHRDPGGLITLATRGFFLVPATLRQRLVFTTGDRVLLAATPQLDQLVLYPMTTVHQALTSHAQDGDQP